MAGQVTAGGKAKTVKRAGAKGDAKEKKPAKAPKPRATVASVSKQLEELDNEIKALKTLLERALAPKPPSLLQVDFGRNETEDEEEEENGRRGDVSGFDTDLLRVLAELDRRGRHDGLVPIPEVREAFLGRGWTRRTFDDRLLQAERDFVVDLKTADDPKRLAEPGLSIRERGRGHLQYVVAR